MEKGINGKLTVLIAALIVAAITFLVFSPSLQNEFLIWDDRELITDNYYIRSLDLNTVKWAFTSVGLTTWHPLTFLSFALDHAIWGLDSWGFHLTNNILHSLNALLVFMLVYWLVNIAGRGNEEEGRNELALVTGVVTALLFGLHPLRVESVAWATERKDVLYAFFYLLGILAYLGYASSERRRIRFYVVSVIFFVMSLMSKPMAVTLPAVLLILDYYPLRRIYSGMGMDRIRVVAFEKIPFFLLSVLMSVLTVLLDNPEKFSLTGLAEHPLSERFFLAMHNYLFYIYKMVLPTDLVPLLPNLKNIDLFSFKYMGIFALFSAITISSILLLKRNRVYISAWLYYIVTLLPVIGLLIVLPTNIRFTYLPSLGPSLIAGLAVGSIYKRIARRHLKIVVVIAVLSVMTLFANKTVKQIGIWKDTITLWSYQIELYPDNYVVVAYLNRGLAYKNKGMIEEAINDFSKVIETDPGHAEAYSNRGKAFESMGKLELAINDFTNAIALNPVLAGAYSNRGNTYMRLQRSEDAIKDYTMAIEIDPEYSKAYSNRGAAYATIGKFEFAIRDYSKAIEITPWNAKAYSNRGYTYEGNKMYKEALRDYTKAIELEPGFTRFYDNRGHLYWKTGKLQKAIDDYKTALKLDPENSMFYFYIGLCYDSLGEKERSIEHIKKAADLGNKNAKDYLLKKASVKSR